MLKPFSKSEHKSQRLGSGYEPKSKLDLYNPGHDYEANQEVVAFLRWLDERDNKAAAIRERAKRKRV